MSFMVTIAVIGLVALAVLLSMPLLRSKKPNYFIRPIEIADAEARCATEGGLEGLGVVVGGEGVTFTAICKNGKQLVWEK